MQNVRACHFDTFDMIILLYAETSLDPRRIGVQGIRGLRTPTGKTNPIHSEVSRNTNIFIDQHNIIGRSKHDGITLIMSKIDGIAINAMKATWKSKSCIAQFVAFLNYVWLIPIYCSHIC